MDKNQGAKNLKGTWGGVFKDFVLVVLLMCAFRWAVAEPFLVPSGSMIPTLLVKDYILVSKFSYGLRVPFTKNWLFGPRTPKRGDVVVFRSKDDNFYFMVKRVVGLPGDKIAIDTDGQRLSINGKPVAMEDLNLTEDDFKLFVESLPQAVGEMKHMVQYAADTSVGADEFDVPAGHIFLMGDNRDRSSDSRAWGSLPIENLLGKAQFIWMSCDDEAPAGSILCLDEHMRRERVGIWIN